MYLLLGIAIIGITPWITNNAYLYKGIVHTYLEGKKGPDIDQYQIFENREVKAGNYQPWLVSTSYNQQEIPGKCIALLEEMETVAYLIIRDDSIICEKYWDGYSDSSYTNSFSMAKTFVSILTGIAIKEGKIRSVDQKVSDFLMGYEDELAAQLTIKHLLTMSSGINFDESYVNPFGFPARAYFGDDIKSLVGNYLVAEAPGKEYEYLSGNTLLLGIVLEKAIGESLAEYASQKLWKPIGAKAPAFWSLDKKEGIEKAYCCFNSNARDFARIGKLYLNNGRWGAVQVVPKTYVAKSIMPADLVEKDTGNKLKKYGYSWWMADYRGHHIYLAEGLKGQYVAVIPKEKTILVRLGRKKAKEKVNGLPADLYTYIDHVLELK